MPLLSSSLTSLWAMYWIHTHDSTGWIHVEAPRKIRATLGQFFDVWGQPLSREKVLDVDLGRRPSRCGSTSTANRMKETRGR
jgi:hypothetical protein